MLINFVVLNLLGSRVTQEHRSTTHNSVLPEQNARTNRRTTMPSASAYLLAYLHYLFGTKLAHWWESTFVSVLWTHSRSGRHVQCTSGSARGPADALSDIRKLAKREFCPRVDPLKQVVWSGRVDRWVIRLGDLHTCINAGFTYTGTNILKKT